MPLPVVCPHCGEELDIPPELRGREVRCAGCRSVFTPPADRGSEPPTARVARDLDDDLPPRRSVRRDEDRAYRDDDLDDDRPRRRPRRSGSTAWVWFLLLGTLVLCVLPCGGVMIWAVALQFPDFQPYNAPDGTFRAEFPGQPYTFTEKTEERSDRHCVEFRRSLPEETYFVHYTDVPRTDRRGTDRILSDAADRLVRAKPGWTETSRTTGLYHGHESVDLKAENPTTGAGMVVRLVMAGRRLYTVGISCEQGIEFEEPRASHFLDAFAVVNADPPAGAKK